ncbi:MAG TPA: NifU family protein [Ktedonobacteraceae bacterium]|jgi:Fe-S cluster biogenesis protein NfuA|nr:NifU family protein [Ktedonobacteraceae bacterium]
MPEDTQEHQRRAARIEELIEQVNELPDAHTRTMVEELIQSLLDMYGEGLARILELTVTTDATSYALLKTFSDDDLIGSLLLLHDLHPLDLETRVLQALDEVRPYLKSHGGNVELIGVDDGVARLRLEGSCNGCAASAITLKNTIEEAINKVAPDLERLDVEGVNDQPPTRTIAPVTFVPRRKQEKVSSEKS